MTIEALRPTRSSIVLEEIRKLPAFIRRDLLTDWSYRLGFFVDWFNLVIQITLFYFIGKMVDPATLPVYAGQRVSYMEFIAIGVVVTSFIQIALATIPNVMRQDQLMGTLEPVLVTPITSSTYQLGAVIYGLVYVPLRSMLFLFGVSLMFGVSFHYSGLHLAVLVLLAFIPFVWGLGVLSAAGVMTFKRGGNAVNLLVLALTLGSGAYFPVGLLPGWLSKIAEYSPLTIAISTIRNVLLGRAGLTTIAPKLGLLIPMSVVSLTVGLIAFHLALTRERHRGTIGQY
jgi:ABC-2 type transport system permease protein